MTINPDELNEGSETGETPEQKATSEQLRQMAEDVEASSSKQEKGELPDPKKEIEDYLKEKIKKEKGSLQVAEGHRDTYESMQKDALCLQAYFEKAKDNVFPDELYQRVQQELTIVPSDPIDEEDYQQHKEEYDRSRKEYEEREARVKRMLLYMDQFRQKPNK